MERPDPSPVVLLIGGDLQAVARVEAACAAAGAAFRRGSPADLEVPADAAAVASLVIVDLDAAPRALEGLAGHGAERDRVIAFYSHVDEDARRRARAAGVVALPRGRFWRELPELVARLTG